MKVYRQGAVDSVYGTDLEVNWVLTQMCNYCCSYCFGQEKIDPDKFSTWDELKNAVGYIRDLKRTAYTVTLAGGEPTIHPHYLKLVNHLCSEIDSLKHLITVTNASRSVEFYKQLLPIADRSKIKLTISYHSEFADIDHIADLIRNLSDDLVLDIRMMYNPQKLECVKSAFNRLLQLRDEYSFRCQVALLRQGPKFDILDERYTEDDIRWADEANLSFNEKSNSAEKVWKWEDWNFFYDIGTDVDRKREYVEGYDYNKMLETGLGNFRNMYCLADTSVINVQWDGTTRGGNCPAMNRVYNIYKPKEDHGIETVPYIVKCNLEGCGCKPNHTIPKFSDHNEAMAFLRMYKEKLHL